MFRKVCFGAVFAGVFVCASSAFAAWTLDPALTQAVTNVVVALDPKAQAAVDEANKLTDAKAKEDFLIAKAKTFMGEKNYATASQVAQYVLTNVNSKSTGAKKIADDAKAKALEAAKATKTGAQVQNVTDSTAAVASDVKSLFGAFGKK